ncbi:hypothetical protein EV356DRAFT_184251 [Viridothelium virens]|uniref:Uncharacterized protein n=1 Tax=Viridothelium virens TaxID=1048519 RepID=A0A6A6H7J1_VIRVR|nr:hypothetical protein EV356DRAFT_184251 [Viridothelium virens]
MRTMNMSSRHATTTLRVFTSSHSSNRISKKAYLEQYYLHVSSETLSKVCSRGQMPRGHGWIECNSDCRRQTHNWRALDRFQRNRSPLCILSPGINALPLFLHSSKVFLYGSIMDVSSRKRMLRIIRSSNDDCYNAPGRQKRSPSIAALFGKVRKLRRKVPHSQKRNSSGIKKSRSSRSRSRYVSPTSLASEVDSEDDLEEME